MKTESAPVGPTTSMSMSSGHVWLKPLRASAKPKTFPPRPGTTIVDGYGVAGPAVVGNVIVPVLVNVNVGVGFAP